MAQSVTVPVLGLMTDLNPLVTGSRGALRLADDIVIERPGVASPRPALSLGTPVSTSNRPRSLGIYGSGTVVINEWDGVSTWAVRLGATTSSALTVPTGGAEPVDYTESFAQFVEARRNLYWCSKVGPMKVSSIVDTEAVAAGMHEATSGEFSLSSAGTPVVLPTAAATAWRWCFRKIDANGVETRSAPSPWQSYSNTSGSTTDMNWLIPLPAYVNADDQIELYRTEYVEPATAIPSDQMYLAKRYTVTSSDVTAGYATVEDKTADADLGAELYTNATRDGFLGANGRPPASRAMAMFGGCMWWGGTIGPWTAAVDIKDVSGPVTSDGSTGLQRLTVAADATDTSDVLTNLAATTSIEVGMLVGDSAAPGASAGTVPAGTFVLSKTATTVTMSNAATATAAGASIRFFDSITVDGQAYYASASSLTSGDYPSFVVTANDPERTARSLAYVISRKSATVFAYAIEDPYAADGERGFATKGTVVIRSTALDDAIWTVTSTRTAALSYPVNTSGGVLVDRDDRPGAVAWSKIDQPEHAPETQWAPVGSERDPIYALVPLRGALLVFKRDGIYRISGSAPSNWRVDLLDSSQRVFRGECVDRIDNAAVAWTQHGVVMVDEGGVQSISAGMIDEELSASAYNHYVSPLTTGMFVRVWSSRGLVLVGAPSGQGSADADYVYCWASSSRQWTRWTRSMYCAVENKEGTWYYARSGLYSIGSGFLAGGTFNGYDEDHTIDTLTLDAGRTTATIADADLGSWVPKECDWLAIVTVTGGSPVIEDELLAQNATPGQLELRPVTIATFPETGPYVVELDDGSGGTEENVSLGTSTSPYDRIILSDTTPVVGTYNAGPSKVSYLTSVATTTLARVTSATDGSGSWVLGLSTAIPAGTVAYAVAYEGIRSRIQWQAHTAGSPAVDGMYREIHVALDWSDYTGSAGGTNARMLLGGSSNVTRAVTTVEWTQARAADPSVDARAMMPRALARCAHLYPYLESCDFGLEWRCLGVSLVYESTSERTRR